MKDMIGNIKSYYLDKSVSVDKKVKATSWALIWVVAIPFLITVFTSIGIQNFPTKAAAITLGMAITGLVFIIIFTRLAIWIKTKVQKNT